ncbi:MAG: nucleotidyltransferase [Chitinophagaceae bacterium]
MKRIFIDRIDDEQKEIVAYAASSAEERIVGLLYLQSHWIKNDNSFMNLSDDFYLRFVALLNKHKVQYLLIGGFAVNFHGYPRTSHDMDIWANPDSKNSEKLLDAINEFGYDTSILEGVYLRGNDVVKLQDEDFSLRKIEILADVSGLYDFDDAYTRKETLETQGVTFYFLSYEDLLKTKASSMRVKDMEDIKYLERIRLERQARKGKK